jgi:glutamine synthetase
MSEVEPPRRVFDSFLRSNADINFIRFEWLDLFGVLRTRVVTSDHACRLESTGRRISLQPAALWLNYVGTPDRAPPAGDARLYPDWSSVSRFPYLPGYASVICNVCESSNHVGFGRCPHTLLIRRLEAASSLEFFIGFEIELVLINPFAGCSISPGYLLGLSGRSMT